MSIIDAGLSAATDVNKIKGVLGLGGGTTTSGLGEGSVLSFPEDLETDGPQQIILFTCYERKGDAITPFSVSLPIPAGITFGDGANFGGVDLGILGGIASQLASGESPLRNTTLESSGFIDGIVKQLGSTTSTAQAATIGAAMLPFTDNHFSVNQRAIVNPNTNTTFQGNTIREFTFAFKMIASSQSESDTINKIQKLFRKYTYASSQKSNNRFTLDYPPVWKIQFIDTSGEHKYFPKIFSCYLSSTSTVFNGDAVNYYPTGAPMFVDVTLNFRETRVLTREDIENMDSERGIDPSTGNPSIDVINIDLKKLVPEEVNDKDTGNES